MTQPSVVIDAARVTLDGRVLFRDLNLQAYPGQTLLVKGPSGGGKSTLLKCILGFVPLDHGRILVLKSDVTGVGAWEVRRHVAYVPQEADLGDNTAGDWLKQAFSYAANRHLRHDPDRVAALLDELGLPAQKLNTRTNELSGGEKQRIAILGALLLERPVLLLDEPTSALDPEARKRVYKLLLKQTGKTILAVSHDDGAAEFLPAREVWLSPATPETAAPVAAAEDGA